MNICMFNGRLCADPIISATQDGKKIGKFKIAVYRNKNASDFIDCVSFDKNAELIEQHFHKGDGIGLRCHFLTNAYTKEDKTRAYSKDFVVDQIFFTVGKKSDLVDATEENGFKGFEDVNDTSLPFN